MPEEVIFPVQKGSVADQIYKYIKRHNGVTVDQLLRNKRLALNVWLANITVRRLEKARKVSRSGDRYFALIPGG